MAGLKHRGQLLGRVHPVVHAEAGLAGVEGGQLLGAVADDGHALGFQIFQSQPQVQNGLGTGADHHHRGLAQLLQVGGDVHGGFRSTVHTADAAGGEGQPQVQNGLGTGADHHHRGLAQLLQVGGDVHGGFRSTVHTADAAGGEDGNAGHVGDDHGGGNGGSTVLAPGAQHCQVPAGGLGDGLALLAEVLDFLSGQASLQAAADDGDGAALPGPGGRPWRWPGPSCRSTRFPQRSGQPSGGRR